MNRPNLDQRYFWDTKFENIDWPNAYRTVITRIIERGPKEDWEEVIRFYGRNKVIHALKFEIPYLIDEAIEDVCEYFHLRKEDLYSYQRKQSMPRTWL